MHDLDVRQNGTERRSHDERQGAGSDRGPAGSRAATAVDETDIVVNPTRVPLAGSSVDVLA